MRKPKQIKYFFLKGAVILCGEVDLHRTMCGGRFYDLALGFRRNLNGNDLDCASGGIFGEGGKRVEVQNVSVSACCGNRGIKLDVKAAWTNISRFGHVLPI